MTIDDDTTRYVRAWLAVGTTTLPERVIDEVLSAIPTTPQLTGVGRSWRPSVLGGLRTTIGLAASLALIAVTVGLLSTRGSGGLPPAVSPTPTSLVTAGDIVGLPAPGANLSAATDAPLVLQYAGDIGNPGVGPGDGFWLYGDGRLISIRTSMEVGLAERRLTAPGVEFVRQRVIVTGLFDADRSFGGVNGFLDILLRNGDGFVHLTWSPTYPQPNLPAPSDGGSALRELSRFLADPTGWPATAWVDATARDYLPARYALCVRDLVSEGHFDLSNPDGIRARLPQAAQDILATGTAGRDGFCTVLVTADAYRLATTLAAAGLRRDGYANTSWLRYVIPDGRGGMLWYSFEPVLPDGTQTWLGPG